MPGDAIKVASHAYKVVLENQRVRVLEFNGKAGIKTEMHHHPATVVVAVSRGKYRFTHPGGHTMEAELQPGQSMYLDAVDHAAEVLEAGRGGARVLLIELK